MTEPGEQESEQALAKLRENSEMAMARADEFARRFPKSQTMLELKYWKANAHWRLAQLDIDPANHLKNAEVLTDEIIAAKPPEPLGSNAHILQIVTAVLRGDSNRALLGAETFLKKYPHHERAAEVQYFIADTADRLGQIDRAKTAARKLVQNYPKSDEADAADALLRRLDILGKPLTDLKFTALDGRKVDMKDYRGKVLLLDFWATWCGPCRQEMPQVIKTYNDFHAQGFEVIGISLDNDQKPLEKYVTDNQMLWPEFFDGQGWKNALATRFGIRSIPSNFLVDQKGIVVRADLYGEKLEQAVKSILTPKK